MRFLVMAIVFAAGVLSGGVLALYGPRLLPPAAVPRVVDLSVQDGGIYHVRAVIDGDTIVLDNGLHVRYLGINAPETGHFVKDAAPLAEEATRRNTQLVEGRRVKLLLPRDPLDIHGRLVARLEVLPEEGRGQDDAFQTDPARVLLQEGLAHVMTLGLDHQQSAEMKQLENEARDRKAGLWGLEDKVRAESGGKPYIAASSGTVYHLRTCATARRIRNANLHEYASAEEAERAGYKPCSKCILKEGKDPGQ